MNARRHRTVFNRHRGQWMAVAETTRSCSGGSGGLRRSVQAVALSWALFGASLLQAQVVADPNAASAHRPGVTASANGTPLVQITAPSAAGVSRNVYRRFDVDSAGVILNNSHGDTTTQLGGWVQGNPQLAGGRARVILNEVNSTDPSQLRGAIEVAGQRADVIVANPAGIVVNGGSFINAARTTLTTGTPVMANGALEGFAVRSGTVRIEGLGLDAASTDHALVLARAIEVNAGVWARQLTAVAGSNDVNTDASRITPAGADGTPPRVAIDVAALGGMYAEHIRLVGTEAGLGVNHSGLMDAATSLSLDVNGWITSTAGARSFSDTVSLRAQGLRNEQGSVIAARSRLAVSAGDIRNTGGALLFSLGDIDLRADNGIENRSATIEALGRLDIDTPVLLNIDDGIEYQVVSGDATSRGDYHNTQGYVGSENVAWAVTEKERANFSGDKLLLNSSAYANPAYRGYRT